VKVSASSVNESPCSARLAAVPGVCPYSEHRRTLLQCLLLYLLDEQLGTRPTLHMLQAALSLLSRMLHCSPGVFGFAGTKDKRAVGGFQGLGFLLLAYRHICAIS
jgi:hypothetical protein